MRFGRPTPRGSLISSSSAVSRAPPLRQWPSWLPLHHEANWSACLRRHSPSVLVPASQVDDPSSSGTGVGCVPDGRKSDPLHGVNMVSKVPPYAPSAAGFSADDIKFLKNKGFNTVRLGVIYKAVEPSPGSTTTLISPASRVTQRKLASGHQLTARFPPGPLQQKFRDEWLPDPGRACPPSRPSAFPQLPRHARPQSRLRPLFGQRCGGF